MTAAATARTTASRRGRPDAHYRRLGLDALRGVAVLLMLEQHLGSWLWRGPGFAGADAGDVVFLALNGLGGLAFPLFIALSGAGNALLSAGEGRALDALLLRRGAALWSIALLVNLTAPSWFSWGSFFALHTIAAATLLTPALRRLSTAALLAGAAVVLAATPIVQEWLGTSALLDNVRMGDVTRPGGALRLVIAEGHYPLLPWLAVYIAGMLAGRQLRAAGSGRVAWLAAAALLCGSVLVGVDAAGLAIPAHPVLARAVRLPVPFFPASPAIVLLLTAVALGAVAAAVHMERRRGLTEANALVALGRASLTIFVVHIWLVRDLSGEIGLWRVLPSGATLLAVAALLAAAAALTQRWQRVAYRGGAERLVRAVAG